MGLALQPVRAEPEGPAPVQQGNRAYLPILSEPVGLPAQVRFGTAMTNGRLDGEGTLFAAGRTTLFYEVTVEGGAGLPLRLEWRINGQRQPALDRATTLAADGSPFSGGIALSTSAPLPVGSYRLRVFVNGLSSGEGRAQIQ